MNGKGGPMDMGEVIQKMVKADRAERLKNSPQLSLGEIIAKLEGAERVTAEVQFDFERLVPTSLDSWRGSYDELGLGFRVTGYTDGADDKLTEPTVESLLKELRGAIGKTYTGWKGGDFEMGRRTPVWVANPGNCGNTAIVDVKDHGHTVILVTAWCEY
jgi:hypothetical protein